jgi:hypothetical protein
MFQCVKFDVNIKFLPVKIPEVFTEIENLIDRRFLERGVLLKRDKELTFAG